MLCRHCVLISAEEYQIQRYEGASTIFGPHTLSAYIQLFQSLASDINDGALTPSGSQVLRNVLTACRTSPP